MGYLIPNIIHNPDRLDRKERLLKELDYQGIKSFRIWNSIHHPKNAQTGINLAHKQIVKWAKSAKEKEVLIFEDDIRFCGKGAFKYYIENKPKDFDIYLGGIYRGKIEDDNTVNQFAALHCYIINERFYDTFLNTNNEDHLDGALSYLGKFVVCNPFAAIQYNGYSDNNKQYCNFDVLLENRNLFTPLNEIGIEESTPIGRITS